MKTFDQLNELLDNDPAGYRKAIAELRERDPERFEAFVDHAKVELERANGREDRPLTKNEIDQLVDDVSEDLGWSRDRVIAEAVLRLQTVLLTTGFAPVTPEEGRAARATAYRRRRSSILAIVLGDMTGLVEKHARTHKRRVEDRDSGRYSLSREEVPASKPKRR